jgi:DNA polymerase-3 subunit gamma/tau
MALSQKHLTTSYRPQTFEQVLGQEQIRQILSKSAAEDKIAPAYMFSGTRGVGKTTIARIMAKAMNCEHGPAAEPCNECHFCRQITGGTSLDVVEIDGASHTGVDHVRKLNEEVGYAPLECRYKVVIIDEAHMLSRSAFNALLKTLEEPPRHACFMLATTEPHKFPTTIVSRCQHFVFQRIPQNSLDRYLATILDREGVGYQPEALSLLARKGAGSVRDCMSLLSQVLALGEDEVRSDAVRDILGMAGHEMMRTLVQAFADQDVQALIRTVRTLFDQGLDLSFFLQELTGLWRNLFLLKQTGEKGLDLLEMPEEEARDWLEVAGRFPLSRIHGAWQMTLEGQKRVMTSLEPSLALELLLLNIAFQPDMSDIGSLKQGQTPPAKGNPSANPPRTRPRQTAVSRTAEKGSASAPEHQGPEPPSRARDWEGFVAYVQSCSGHGLPNLGMISGEVRKDCLELHCSPFMGQRLQDQAKLQTLKNLVRDFFQRPLEVNIVCGQNGQGNGQGDLKQRVLNDSAVKGAMETFQAKVVDISPRKAGGREQGTRGQ